MQAAMPTAEQVSGFLDSLAGWQSATNDTERIDLITELERLKGAAAAAQARLTATFEASQRAEQTVHGVPAHRVGKGIANQVALARRESPHKGGRLLGHAKALVRDMPHTLRALATGQTNEWRTTLVVREAITLTAEHRAQLDAELAGKLAGLGDKAAGDEARKIAYRLEPGTAARRKSQAESERRVTIRPAPDTMSYLTGLLPVAQGVAVHTALGKAADALRAAGDPRTRSQLMADLMVERITGQASAGAVPTEICLVLSDRALFGDDDTPGHLVGFGPVPATLGRSLVAATDDGLAGQAQAWIRRLYTCPVSGDLIAMDAKRRLFPQALRRFLVIRDQTCRTPWCDAPIRHTDHIVPAAAGGPTTETNGQGLCEACNQAKEAPGWRAWPTRAGPRQAITVQTPTGHRYTSTAPQQPGTRAGPSRLEAHFRQLIASA